MVSWPAAAGPPYWSWPPSQSHPPGLNFDVVVRLRDAEAVRRQGELAVMVQWSLEARQLLAQTVHESARSDTN